MYAIDEECDRAGSINVNPHACIFDQIKLNARPIKTQVCQSFIPCVGSWKKTKGQGHLPPFSCKCDTSFVASDFVGASVVATFLAGVSADA
mmetsp:Transcript_12872/g.21462  ORF Transcript_12872/g.21462 Transcript_12872/m.21462 type:complete len:91 (-) Transcript_12872:136-408(-)